MLNNRSSAMESVLAAMGERTMAKPAAQKKTSSYEEMKRGLPPCKNEDDTNCYWDATKQGNGQGRSFIDVDGGVYYEDDPMPGEDMPADKTQFRGTENPLWEEAKRVFIDQEGREPATDEDMEVTMQEIMDQLQDSDAGAEQPTGPVERTAEDEVLETMLGAERPPLAHGVMQDRAGTIPQNIWNKAEQMYIDKYGEEGLGGDGSMELIERMAMDLMSNRGR